MFRYRCPECRQVLQAPEIRAGKATVCPKCSTKITIPADSALWLKDDGALPQPVVEPKSSAEIFAPILIGPADPAVRVAEPDPLPPEPLKAAGTTAPLRPIPTPKTESKPKPEAKTSPPRKPEAKPAPEPKPAPKASSSPEVKLPPEPPPRAEPRAPVVPPTPEPKPTVEVKATPVVREPTAPEVVKLPPPAAPIPKATEPAQVPPPVSPEPMPTLAAITPPQPAIPEPLAAVESVPPPIVKTPEVKVPPVAPPVVEPAKVPPRRVVTTPVSPAATTDDRVSFNQPLHLRSEMDIAAALTDVLTTRMKPPPKPPRDLYPSTAFWLLLTGIALALLGMTLFKPVDHLKWVMFIGAAEIAIGYVWIVVLAFRRDPARAVSCAIPPITFWYLIKKRYRRYRPLRFVVTGAVLFCLAKLAPAVMPETRRYSGADQPSIVIEGQDPSTMSDVEQLKLYREKRQFDRLIDLLRKLDRTDPLYSSSASQREALATELRQMADPTKTGDAGIRAAALPAYVRWGGDDARAILLAAVQGHPDERRQAIQLLHKWPDADVARIVASRLGNREEAKYAKDALINIGGSTAVQALVPLLRDKEKDKVLHLTALDLLANPAIGNEEALEFLRAEKDKFTDQTLNRQVERTILTISNNLRLKRGG